VGRKAAYTAAPGLSTGWHQESPGGRRGSRGVLRSCACSLRAPAARGVGRQPRRPARQDAPDDVTDAVGVRGVAGELQGLPFIRRPLRRGEAAAGGRVCCLPRWALCNRVQAVGRVGWFIGVGVAAFVSGASASCVRVQRRPSSCSRAAVAVYSVINLMQPLLILGLAYFSFSINTTSEVLVMATPFARQPCSAALFSLSANLSKSPGLLTNSTVGVIPVDVLSGVASG